MVLRLQCNSTLQSPHCRLQGRLSDPTIMTELRPSVLVWVVYHVEVALVGMWCCFLDFQDLSQGISRVCAVNVYVYQLVLEATCAACDGCVADV